MTGQCGTRDVHHQTEVRGQAITGTQDSSTQFIATCAAMTTFKLSQQRTGNATPCRGLQVTKETGMRTLISR